MSPFQAEEAQLERSRKAALRRDKEKEKAKSRRAAQSLNTAVVPEYIPDCIRSAYKKRTAHGAVAKKGEKPQAATRKSTRRTAKEQADYEKTMAALDKMIGKSAEEALQELEDEEEEEEENGDSRPMTRGRNKK